LKDPGESCISAPEPGKFGQLLPWSQQADRQRFRILDDVASLKIRWDQSRNHYVFLDGSWLPETERKLYRREYWMPSAEGLDVELAVERRDHRFVRIQVTEFYRTAREVTGRLQLFRDAKRDRPIVEVSIGRKFTAASDATTVKMLAEQDGTVLSSQVIELSEGGSLQSELILDGRVERGPLFIP